MLAECTIQYDTKTGGDVYFFVEKQRDWNALPYLITSSAEGAENGLASFTSLVRARDLFRIWSW